MKIMIFGCPGSGKSTFAAKLAKKINIPLYHLDKYFFTQNWQPVDYGQFIEKQWELVEQDEWIIEGCGMRSLHIRLMTADLVLYFDIPRRVCLWRILKRWAKGKRETDCKPEGCPEVLRYQFVKYVWHYQRRYKKYIQMLLEKYAPEKEIIIFTSNQQAEKWLNSL